MSDAAPPFVIFALPRSRTFWCSRYLSYAGWHCGHDEVRHLRSLDDVRSWLAQPAVGTVETAGAPFWRLLRSYRPDARIALIRRPVEEVIGSLLATGLQFDRPRLLAILRHFNAKLDQIAARCPDALTVTFEQLNTEAGCAALFEHCLPYQHDHGWWAHMAPLNLQVDLAAYFRYCHAHSAQLEKMAKTAKHRMLANIMPRTECEGVTFQTEPLNQAVVAEASRLASEHCVQAGFAPDAHQHFNWPVFYELDKLGALQITTARCNGRLFGYLITIIGPSLETLGETEALHTVFFADPTVRNIGMGLQRAAVAGLKQRGVADLYMRAGVRASGPRLGTFYRRLGAEPFGQMFRLELEAADGH